MKENKDYIIDELLKLNVDNKKDAQTKIEDKNAIKENKELSIEETQNKIVEENKTDSIADLELNNAMLDPKNDTFITTVKDNVNFCVNEIKEVNDAMEKISNQKNTELFFKKSENIRLLSQYMSKIASVNQKTIDLLILLLGASGKISTDYETILSTIDELGELNNGEAEVLNYLIKIKKMVYEIRDNDTKIQQVIENNNITKEIVTNANESLKKEIKESQKSRKLIDSKCNRLLRKIQFNNLCIGICFALIICLSIFIGIKFYVH